MKKNLLRCCSLVVFLLVSVFASGQGQTCLEAVAIEPGSHTADGPADGAGSSTICDATAGPNADWYSFTPAADGTITVTSCGSGVDTQLSIFSGSCDALVCQGSNDDTSCPGFASRVANLAVSAGITYYIQWDNDWTSAGFDWSLTFVEAVSCQDVEYSLNLTSGSFASEVSWNILNSEGVLVLSGGAPFSGVACLADDCYTLEMIDSWGDGWNGAQFSLSLDGELVAGPTTLPSGLFGTADFALGDAVCELPEPPANDLCADAIELIVDGDTLVGDNTNATADGPAMACAFAGDAVGADIWFSFVAPAEGNITVSTFGGGLTDTQIQILDGCGGAILACAEDQVGLYAVASIECGILTPGATYLVQVDGYSSDRGEFSIAVSSETCIVYDCPELEANIGESCNDQDATTENDLIVEGCACEGTLIQFDCPDLLANIGASCDDLDPNTSGDVVGEDCVCAGISASENNQPCAAAPIACGSEIAGSTATATISSLGTPSCASGTSADVFYSFTALPGVTYTIVVNGANYDGVLAIFSGDCDGELVQLACADNGFTAGIAETIELTVEAETEILIQTYDWFSNRGEFILSLSCQEGFDCELLEANIGDACDDENDNTINDLVGEDCICAGDELPENDQPCAAISLECGDVAAGSTQFATESGLASPSCTGGSKFDLFYSIDAVPGVIYSVTLNGANYDGVLIAYSGACDSELEELDCSDSGFTQGIAETIEFQVEEPGAVLIRTYDWSSSRGEFEIAVSCEVIYDCPQYAANIGDACDDGDDSTENDLLGEDCACAGTPIVVDGCEDFVVYLADRKNGLSTIYGIEFIGGDAVLEPIAVSETEIHIAYSPIDNHIYAVSKADGSYRKLNPHEAAPEFGPVQVLDVALSQITTAIINQDNKLLVGSVNEDEIYSIDLSTNIVSLYDSSAPIDGGDLALDNLGMLYLATKAGNGLYQVYPADVLPDQLIGNTSAQVTGLALSADDRLLLSHTGSSVLELRELDGSNPAQSFNLILNGESFVHGSGDLASGCNTFFDENEGECESFETFYASHGPGISGTDIYGVVYSGGDAIFTLLTNVGFEAHIAYNAEDDVIYLVNANGSFIRAYDPTTDAFLGDLAISGGINQLYAIVYNPEDGKLYVGDANDNEIFTVDLGSGAATYFADGPVEGGDLAIQDGTLFLATRSQNRLMEIVEGGAAQLIGNIPSGVNGMAQANNATGLILSNFGSAQLTEVSAADGSIVASYNAILNGSPFTLVNGDLAAGCADDDGDIVPEPGACYATEIIEYVQGVKSNGNALDANRTDESKALGEPERIDGMVFTTLGYGGSIVFAFDGAVPNLDGVDIEVVETSFGNPGCASYPEYADVYVSLDGIDWFLAGTVCKGDGFVDISDAGEFDYVNYVKVANNDDLTSTPDAYDVDGIVALHNCIDQEEDGNGGEETAAIQAAEGQDQLSSLPNPTTGPSQVVFVTAETGMTTVEVYDMSGRNVATLFNQEAQAGAEYRVDFNGEALPNGVYIYRMTTGKEVTINKFMIAK